MAKKIPLLKRLELALTQTTSNSEKNEVYALLYKTAKNSISNDLDLFYGRVNHETLSISYNRKTIFEEEVEKGKKLAEILQSSVNLPISGNKDYRKKMISAMEVEYDVLRGFLKNE